MGAILHYKVKADLDIPHGAMTVFCLPGDGYIGKFCAESLISTTQAKRIQIFHPFSFPARALVQEGNISLQSFEIYAGNPPWENLLVITTDLRAGEAEPTLNACRLLVDYVRQYAPSEILIFDGFAPAVRSKKRKICEIQIGTPPADFWGQVPIIPFKFPLREDKFFLFLTAALEMSGQPARALICETSNEDVDPEGAKILLTVAQGHPAFPPELQLDVLDEKATLIRNELANTVHREQEREVQESAQPRDQSDLYYIQ